MGSETIIKLDKNRSKTDLAPMTNYASLAFDDCKDSKSGNIFGVTDYDGLEDFLLNPQRFFEFK